MAFGAIACLMMISAGLQLSLVSRREWDSLWGRMDQFQQSAILQPARSVSQSAMETLHRCYSRCSSSSLSSSSSSRAFSEHKKESSSCSLSDATTASDRTRLLSSSLSLMASNFPKSILDTKRFDSDEKFKRKME